MKGVCSMSLEENKAIVRKYAEELNKRNHAIHDELIAPDFVDHALHLRGLESYKQYETIFTKGFPDMHRTIEDIIAEGDKVWIRMTGTATHTGEFLGLAPTGKKITLTGVMIWRIVDGKIVEKWAALDNMDFYKQLGLIEYTEKGKKIFPEDAK